MNPWILQRIKGWQNDPVLFVQDCLEMKPTDQQLELLEAIKKACRGEAPKKISVRSGHGTGKDAIACAIILWFMCTRFNAKVACFAPTARQLQDVLWSELGKWLLKSKVRDDFVKIQHKFFHKDFPDTWWTRTLAPASNASKEEQAETTAGLHGDHFLVIADEASGIKDPIFQALEGALTQDDNWILLIGNMTKTGGYYYDSHFHQQIAPSWQRLHWRSDLSSNVKKSYVDYMALKYGVESNVYKIRVLGDPPLADANTLIPLEWARNCIDNDIPASAEDVLYLGADIARFGDDDTIILPRRGLVIHPWIKLSSVDTFVTANKIAETIEDTEAEGAAIDEIGIGAGVVDWLSKTNNSRRIFGVNVSMASSDITKYSLLRDELWWRVRERCRLGQYSFPSKLNPDGISMGEELANELSLPWYEYNQHGGIKVCSKKEMKRQGIASPNIADALCLTEYFHTVAHRIFRTPKKQSSVKRPWEKKGSVSASDSWKLY